MMRTVRGATAVLLAAVAGVDAQGAAQIGGRPPTAVVTSLCSISDVFAHLYVPPFFLHRVAPPFARPRCTPYASARTGA